MITDVQISQHDPTNGAPYGFIMWQVKFNLFGSWCLTNFSNEEDAKNYAERLKKIKVMI